MGRRLDNFTDSAFAFAVTLLIIGGGSSIGDSDALLVALGDLPAFAFGFAIITMFWVAHVRWRAMRGEGDARGVGLTLLLVFLILIYVPPLRAMAAATGQWFTGSGEGFSGDVATLFTIYGTGFVATSATTAALFADASQSDRLSVQQRAYGAGDRTIWLILAVTGLVSIAVSFTRFGEWAAMVCATLPLTIGIFAARHDWDGKRSG
ncbi:MAG: DUF1211 domain-containing protein [Sphingomonas bacterium]|nr:DUF1211 domain-containing protein [Sphingomonas bacterium]